MSDTQDASRCEVSKHGKLNRSESKRFTRQQQFTQDAGRICSGTKGLIEETIMRWLNDERPKARTGGARIQSVELARRIMAIVGNKAAMIRINKAKGAQQ